MKHHFLWLDLETTGLDPNMCRILEVAKEIRARRWPAVVA
jgi:oligoribonuclease (3'-5' exoribonuclease)